MQKRRQIFAGAAIVAGGALVLTLGMAATPSAPSPSPTPIASVSNSNANAATAFALDPVHSSVFFGIEHFGVSRFYGTFREMSGSFSLGESPADASFNITVKAKSVDTRNEQRDEHLRKPDFFNAIEFPDITFKSTKVAQAEGDDALNVTGDLTLHGVAKPITVKMKTWSPKDTPQGHKAGFETTFTIKRTDFGMDTYVANGGLGDAVTITVACEGVAEGK